MNARAHFAVAALIFILTLEGIAAPSGFPVEASLIRDINPGPDGALLEQFVAVGEDAYFVATDSFAQVNREVWRYDGLQGTAAPVLDLPGSSNPDELTVLGDSVFYVTSEANSGRELWRANKNGAALVADIRIGNLGSNPTGLTAAMGKLFFSAFTEATGRELWQYDPNTDMATLVKDIRLGDASTIFFSNPTGGSNFAATDSLLFFAADDGVNGLELWRTDGTANGTFLVKDINPGLASGVAFSSDPVSVDRFEDMLGVGDSLLFAANDGVHGRELWISDGTEDGTVMVRDIRPGPASSDPFELAELDGEIIFVASEPTTGLEVWRSDGTEIGTTLLADILPGPQSSFPGFLSSVDNRVYFTAETPATGGELWVTNGETAGTFEVADIYPGPDASFPARMVEGPDGLAWFFADNGELGIELWRSNGSAESTVLMADIAPGAASSGPTNRLRATSQRLIIPADDGVHGIEPWSIPACADTTPFLAKQGAPLCDSSRPPPPRRIRVALIQGKLVDARELIVVKMFNTLTISAKVGNSVTALDGTTLNEGTNEFGLVDDIWIGEVYDAVLVDSDFDGLPDDVETVANRFTADGDSNGIPDVAEDGDHDGLTLADEFYLGYNPLAADSDGDQILDGVEHILGQVRKDTHTVDVVINIYQALPGATTDLGHLLAAIAKANRVLASVNVTLIPVDIRTGVTAGDNGIGTGTAGDGSFNELEIYQVLAVGHNEITQLPSKRGLKIAVASNANESTLTLSNGTQNVRGGSLHRIPAVVIKQLPSIDQTAVLIAHEIGHTLTLKHPGDLGETETADDVMTLSTNPDKDQFIQINGAEAFSFTPKQSAQIHASKLLDAWARVQTRKSPARPVPIGTASTTDALGDQVDPQLSHLDLRSVQLTYRTDRMDFQLLIETNAPPPLTNGISGEFVLAMDTDGNPGTGTTVHGLDGVDRSVLITLYVDNGEIRAIANLEDDRLLAIPPMVDVLRVAGAPGNGAFGTLISVPVGADALAVTAESSAARLVSLDATAAVMDEADLTFDRLRSERDPQLQFEKEIVQPGELVVFSLSGMTPGEAFNVTAEGELLFSGTLGGTGEFSGSFPAPTVGVSEVQTIIAMDAQDQYAASALIVPNLIFSSGFEE